MKHKHRFIAILLCVSGIIICGINNDKVFSFAQLVGCGVILMTSIRGIVEGEKR